jgi:predicted DCC family thiol-disulfide oxidoreductase YuxK
MSRSLPTLADRPAADVVIYDGHCRFCTRQVERLAAWDRRGRLAFLSLHDPAVARRYPDLTHDRLMEEMVVVDQQGGRHGGAAAFRYLTRRLPLLWLLAPLLHVPGSLPFWTWCYRQVARRRYLWGRNNVACDDETCRIHMRAK